MEEIERKLDAFKNRPGVKCVIVMNGEGEILTSSINESFGLEDEILHKFHQLAYSIIASMKAAINRFDATEKFQFCRMRMNESELIIVPEDKFIMLVVQNPNL